MKRILIVLCALLSGVVCRAESFEKTDYVYSKQGGSLYLKFNFTIDEPEPELTFFGAKVNGTNVSLSYTETNVGTNSTTFCVSKSEMDKIPLGTSTFILKYKIKVYMASMPIGTITVTAETNVTVVDEGAGTISCPTSMICSSGENITISKGGGSDFDNVGGVAAWQYANGDEWTTITSATSNSSLGDLTVNPANLKTLSVGGSIKFRKVIGDVASNELTVNVYGFPENEISTTAASTLCYNTPVSFSSVSVSGGKQPYSYRWYDHYNIQGEDFDEDIIGTDASCTYTPHETGVHKVYHSVIDACGNAASSPPINFNVLAEMTAGTLSVEGGITEVCDGTEVKINGTAPESGSFTGKVTYKWERSTDNGSTWTQIGTAQSLPKIKVNYGNKILGTTTTYPVKFRRTMYNSCTTEDGLTVPISVDVYAPIKQGALDDKYKQTVMNCSGNAPARIEASAATGGSGSWSYQWEESEYDYTNKVWKDWKIPTNTPMATTLEYFEPGNLIYATKYRRKDINSCGTVYADNIAQFAMYAGVNPGITVAESEEICYNTKPKLLNVYGKEGGDGTEQYKWQYSTNGGATWIDIENSNTASLTAPAITKNTSYQRVTIGGCSELGNHATVMPITVKPQLTAGRISGAQEICYATDPAKISNAESPQGGGGIGTYTYSWEQKVGNGNWSTIDVTSNEYDPPALTQTTSYRRKVSESECGQSATSEPVTIIVKGQLNYGTISGNQSICYNTRPETITGTAATGGSENWTYQWEKAEQKGINDWNDYSIIKDATEINYQPPFLIVTTKFRRKAINSCDHDKPNAHNYSNEIIVTVYDKINAGTIVAEKSTICNEETPVLLNIKKISGGSGAETVQWQRKITAGTWADIASATGNSYYEPTPQINDVTYRRKVVGGCSAEETSNEIAIDVKEPFKVGAIGDNQSICYNTAPAKIANTLSTSGGSEQYEYSWESKVENGNWTSISGNSTEFEPGIMTETTSYRRIDKDMVCGNSVTTNTITITVRPELNGGTISESQAICASTTPKVLTGTEATGGNGLFTYDWEESELSETNAWSPYASVGGTSINYLPTRLYKTTKYRRKAVNNCGFVYSKNEVVITINSPIDAGAIETADSTICYNTKPYILTSKENISGGSGEEKVQWQRSSKYGNNWTNWEDIPGAENLTYQETSSLTQATAYRRKATGGCATGAANEISDALIITVRDEINPGTVTTHNSTICYGADGAPVEELTAASGGGGQFTYNWQFSSDDKAWYSTGSNTINYDPSFLHETTYFRRVATDQVCMQSATSPSVSITVAPDPTPGEIAGDQLICSEIAPMEIEGTRARGGIGEWFYIWESSTLKETNVWNPFNTISGAPNAASYQPDRVSVTTRFRRKAINSTCKPVGIYSNVVTISVVPTIPGGKIAALNDRQTICRNEKPIILSTESGGNGMEFYQWEYAEYKNNMWSDWKQIPGATDEEYTASVEPTTNIKYRRQILNDCTTKIYSNEVEFTLYPQVNAGELTGNQTVCYNTKPFVITNKTAASGGTGIFTYTWQRYDGSNYIDIPLPTNTETTYQPSMLNETTLYRRVAHNECAPAEGVATAPITVTVSEQIIAATITGDQTICHNTAPAELYGDTSKGGRGVWEYQWEESTLSSTGIWSDWAVIFNDLARGQKYAPSSLRVSTKYRRKDINYCGTVTTNEATIMVRPLINGGEISALDNKTSICRNTFPVLKSIKEQTGGVSYQWEYCIYQKTESGSNAWSNWTKIAGATQAEYTSTIPASDLAIRFRRKVIDDCGKESGESNTVEFSVYTQVQPGVINNGDGSQICYGENAGSLANIQLPWGGTGNITYTWEKYVDDAYVPISTPTSQSSYEPGELYETTSFRRVASDGCTTAATEPVTITVTKELNAGEISGDQKICYDANPNLLTGTVAGGGREDFALRYKWEKTEQKGDDVWSGWISVGSDKDYQPDALKVTTKFRRAIVNRCGTKYTNEVLIIVNPELDGGVIAAKDDEKNICYESKPELISVSENTNKSYQWEISTQKENKWSAWEKISGATSASYTSATKAINNVKYRRKVTGTCSTDDNISNEVVFHIYERLRPGAISGNQEICYGRFPKAIFDSIYASGEPFNEIVFTWEKCEEDGEYEVVSTPYSMVYYYPPYLTKTTYYRRVATNECGSVATKPVKITVKKEVHGGQIGPNQTACFNTVPYPLNSIDEVGADSYQWYRSNDSVSWKAIADATEESYTPPVANENLYYKRKAIFEGCGDAESNNGVLIKVTPELKPGKIAKDQLTIQYMQPDKLMGTEATGGKGTINYRWYESKDSITFEEIVADSDDRDYQPGVMVEKTFYKRVVTDDCTSKESNIVKIDVVPSLEGINGGSIAPESQLICKGYVPELITGVAMSGATYKWQQSSDGKEWEDVIIKGTNADYQPGAITEKTYYQRIIKIGSATAKSNPVEVDVLPAVEQPELSGQTTYCEGQKASISITPKPGFIYKWITGKDTIASFKFEVATLLRDTAVSVVAMQNSNKCQSEPLQLVIGIDQVAADFRASKNEVGLGEGAKFTNLSRGAASYEWDFDEGEGSEASGDFTYFFNQPGEKTIRLKATSENGCISEVVKENYILVKKVPGSGIEGPTGVDDEAAESIVVYPNPVEQVLYIDLKDVVSGGTIELYNSAGGLVQTKKIGARLESVDMSSFVPGLYLLRVNDGKEVFNFKVIKR